MEDFIGIKRRINEHWIYKDSQCFHAWFEMLRCARYAKEPKTDIYEGVVYTINYAEFIFGRPSWSKRLGIGEEKLRVLIKRLLTSDMIVLKQKHSKFTIYKIVNYEKYNQHDNHVTDIERSSIDECAPQQYNQQTTSRQPADNQQTTTKEERKERKERKEGNNNIFRIPTIEQVQEYCNERNNSVDSERFIDHYTANGWVQKGGQKIKDWKATVRTWERNNKNKSNNPFA